MRHSWFEISCGANVMSLSKSGVTVIYSNNSPVMISGV
jgi:hypothetical protein